MKTSAWAMLPPMKTRCFTAPRLAAPALIAAMIFAAVAAQARPATATAGSLDGNASAPANRPSAKSCAALRKQYLQSQVCFDHYRLADGGLRPGAAKHCRNVVDPSPRCGPDLPTK